MKFLSILLTLFLFASTYLTAGGGPQKGSMEKKGISQKSIQQHIKRRNPLKTYSIIALEDLCFDSIIDDNDYRVIDLRMASFTVNDFALGSTWPGTIMYGNLGCEVLFQKATSNCVGGLIAYADPSDGPRAAQICDTLSDVFTSSKDFLVDIQGFVFHIYNVDGVFHPIMNIDGIRVREEP
ncbi:MAG: hypothetical protein HYW02_02915 [Deltaproteobacteria bacterium]|nr:hypothetical protein [Deltaproteobacteria bacterium]MBI2500421.1 hypothetical protein [Deltaproteobacteria bacterium]